MKRGKEDGGVDWQGHRRQTERVRRKASTDEVDVSLMDTVIYAVCGRERYVSFVNCNDMKSGSNAKKEARRTSLSIKLSRNLSSHCRHRERIRELIRELIDKRSTIATGNFGVMHPSFYTMAFPAALRIQ